jgi:16S rRNA (adenine1518-N6/adenine1519-N6)-dimethyltransferase
MHLDQHFLADTQIVRALSRAAPIPAKGVVLEIGSGKGALTKELVAHGRVIAVEIDAALAAALPSLVPSPNLKVHHGNALRLYNTLTFDAVVGSLPYSICEPLWKLLLKTPKPSLFVVSKSFADKVMGHTLLGTLTSAVFSAETTLDISPEAFSPPPRTRSRALRLVPHAPPVEPHAREWFDLLYLDKKKLRNALPLVLPGTKKVAKARLADLPDKLLEKKLWQLSQAEFERVDALLVEKKGR